MYNANSSNSEEAMNNCLINSILNSFDMTHMNGLSSPTSLPHLNTNTHNPQILFVPVQPTNPAIPSQNNNYTNITPLYNLSSMPLYNYNNYNIPLSNIIDIRTRPIAQLSTQQNSSIPSLIDLKFPFPFPLPLPTVSLNSKSPSPISPPAPHIPSKPPPLDESQYEINCDGKFRCLIRDESNAVCNKIFAHRSSITRHKYFIHDKYKPFKCDFKGCSLAFGRSHLLKLHSRVHSGEKPYKCPNKSCNKAFKQKGHLTEHIRVHTGERPYKCSFCGVKFRQKSVLDTHKRRHTNEKPYKCELCGKAFGHYTSFWRHRKNQICLKKNRKR